MSTSAAVITGKGTGAISTIQLFGKGAEDIIKRIFRSASKKSSILKTGKICLGKICDGKQIIDQVTIGCEGENNFAINCHGNPLIVADIMKLLGDEGADLISAEQMRVKTLSSRPDLSTIQIEAKLAIPKAKTLEGTKIITNQIEAGLNQTAQKWFKKIEKGRLEQIKTEAKKILQISQIANLITNGCKAVIVGPANTGKSTLLNTLAGRQKAIVTDIKGTTRDWVTAECKVGPVSIEFVDTAGLDEELSEQINKQAQQKAVEILQQAKLVLLVLDINKPNQQLKQNLLEKLSGKKILTVLNKNDLPIVFDETKLPQSLQNTVQISAKYENQINDLAKQIQQALSVDNFNLEQAVCVTKRQQNVLEKLANTNSTKQAQSVITELLNGSVCV